MRPEHVRIQSAERQFGEKNLLHAQLDIISFIRRYGSFKTLRTEEMLLKIALKTKIAEAKESLDLFEKLLPKPSMVPKLPKPSHHEHPPEHDPHHPHHAVHKKQTLQDEVEEIKRKLAALQ